MTRKTHLAVFPSVQAEPLRALIDRLAQEVGQINTEVTEMSAESDRLVASVTRIKTVADGMAAVLADVKTRLDAAIAAGNDPALLAALSQDLDTESDKLVAATIAGTPSA
jgi:hypothetical protein